MKLSVLFLSLFLLSQIANANVLNVENGDQTIEGVKLAKSAIISTEKGDLKLDVIGAGLRAKKVLVANVKVYVLQVLADNAGKFVRTNDGAMKSMDDMNTVAFTLSFLYAASADQMKTAFDDSFSANNVDTDIAGLQDFLTAVKAGGRSEIGKTMSIVVRKLDDKSTKISFETTGGKLTEIKAGPEAFNAITSIWLGNSADNGLALLKTSILKGE